MEPVERVCERCDTIYWTDKFGAGPKFCSRACRHMPFLKRREWLRLNWAGGKGGRPGRFPEPDVETLSAVKEKLAERGWFAVPVYNSTDAFRLEAHRGGVTIKIGIGNDPARTRWAHCIFYTDRGEKRSGELKMASACFKKRVEHPVINPHMRPRKYKLRTIACDEPDNCRKCFATSMLRYALWPKGTHWSDAVYDAGRGRIPARIRKKGQKYVVDKAAKQPVPSEQDADEAPDGETDARPVEGAAGG